MESPQRSPGLCILVLGGYGFFGSHLLHLLASIPTVSMIVAGRHLRQVDKIITWVKQSHPMLDIQGMRIDIQNNAYLKQQLQTSQANFVINLQEDFQSQQFVIAQLCLKLGIHYLDVADQPNFIEGLHNYHQDAINQDVMLVTGLGRFAISATAIEAAAHKFKWVDRIEINCSFGKHITRGRGNLAEMIKHCDKATHIWQHGQLQSYPSWSDIGSTEFPEPIGRRITSTCIAPEPSHFSQRFPKARSILVRSGENQMLLHAGFIVLSKLKRWLPRLQWEKHSQRLAIWLDKLQHIGARFAKPDSAMQMSIYGYDNHDKAIHVRTLLRSDGPQSPYIPLLSISALLRKIQGQQYCPTGVWLGASLLNWDDITQEASYCNIETSMNVVAVGNLTQLR